MKKPEICCAAGLKYAIQFVRGDSVRIRIRRDANFKIEEKEMVAVSPLPRTRVDFRKEKGKFIFSSTRMSVEVREETGQISIYSGERKQIVSLPLAPTWKKPSGESRIREATPQTHWGDGTKPIQLMEPTTYVLPPKEICKFFLNAGSREKYYGFGMTGGPVEWRGGAADTYIKHFRADDYRTPYYFSTAGYSLFLRTTERALFDMCRTRSKKVSVEVDDIDELELFIQCGDCAQCIEGYTWLTGRQPPMPAWIFGTWMGGYWKNQQHLLSIAKNFRKKKIPLDVMRQDSIWQNEHECDFLWDRGYPDAQGMINKLTSMGLKLHLWKAHVVNFNCKNFAEGFEKGAFVQNHDLSIPLCRWWKNKKGAIIDFTKKEACEWWKSQIKPVLKMGVVGYKTDGANESTFVSHDRQFHDGRTGKQAHNIYPVLYAKTTFDAQKEVHGAAMPIWIRSGYAGIQRYPVLWSGDQGSEWSAIHQQLRCGISAGLSGASFWASDGGGFGGKPSEPLYIRGTQFAFWNPVCQPFGQDREPWLQSERACENFRKYAQIRNRLNPYFTALAKVTCKSGLPIMRHMMLEFPNDETCFSLDEQYMLGKAFLVAPVFTEDGKRTVYFPKGEWIDIHTLRIITGPQWVKLDVPLEMIPVYARSGYVVPVKQLSQFIDDIKTDNLSAFYWKGESSCAICDATDGRVLAGTSGGEIQRSLEKKWGLKVTVERPNTAI